MWLSKYLNLKKYTFMTNPIQLLGYVLLIHVYMLMRQKLEPAKL